MATQIYLGMPPPKIKEWIEKNYKPVEPEVDMTKVPLHFTANEDGSSVSLVCREDYEIYDFIDCWCKLDYSMDGKIWNTYIDPDSSDETLHRGKVINLNKGETVYFKATLSDVEENPNLNGFTYYDEDVDWMTKYHCFVMEGSIKADGNIQFLLENTGTKMDVPAYCYYRMFNKNGNHNTTLTQAPKLPATTLADGCYFWMFHGCRSLTQAPELPATTLASRCYRDMFFGCTQLNNINVNFSAWNPSNATQNWVNGVSSSGTFTCPVDLPEEFGDSRIPTGWTVVRK